MIDPVSPAVPSCGHLLIVLNEGLIFSSHKTTRSDICQGYDVGDGPLRGSGIGLLVVVFPHQREALKPGGSLRVQLALLAFLAQSDGALHKGNSITRLALLCEESSYL